MMQSSHLIDDQFFKRFCSRDVTLWAEKDAEKEEVAHRLDWIDAGSNGEEIIRLVEVLLDELILEGFSHAVVLGMGGSSLAPEVFSKVFQKPDFNRKKGLEITILDSTDPEQILEKRKELPLKKTLFIVSSKSGGTTEVNALETYFWQEIINLGIDNPGRHFLAITDPGTSLEKKGKEKKYRQIIQANPNVGGRYSALIEFGLIPAGLMGIDCRGLLEKARTMELDCTELHDAAENPGLLLGSFLAEAYKAGRDKLTIISDSELEALGSWIEQLIAESSGKDGKGILPIDLEPMHEPDFFEKDRVFVYFSKTGRYKAYLEDLIRCGYPAVTFNIDDPYQLGAEIIKWEIATAAACAMIGVNAFDQPNVQLSKSITQGMIAEIKQDSGMVSQKPIFSSDEFDIFGDDNALGRCQNIEELVLNFLNNKNAGDFVALNAFTARNEKYFSSLQKLRSAIAEKTKLATTLGFGPRFLHSTGQIHKGGRNNGHFLVITIKHENDLEIPGEGMSFGTLQFAQAIGDIRALQQMNRHVIRIHLKKGIDSLDRMADRLSGL